MKPEVKIGPTVAESFALIFGKDIFFNTLRNKFSQPPDCRLAVRRERTPGGSAIKLEIDLTSPERRETVPLLQIPSPKPQSF